MAERTVSKICAPTEWYSMWRLESLRSEVGHLWDQVVGCALEERDIRPGWSPTISRLMNVEFLKASAALAAREGNLEEASRLQDWVDGIEIT